jgi:hypothetical protein
MRKIISALFMVGMIVMLYSGATAKPEESFSVREYNQFHEVLHSLQHEALPAKDFKRIRSNAGELMKRGQAIVRVGVPKGTAEKQVADFRRELKKFKEALGKFREHSQKGTDQQLEVSFSAVHDSFEMLAGMLPQKSSN